MCGLLIRMPSDDQGSAASCTQLSHPDFSSLLPLRRPWRCGADELRAAGLLKDPSDQARLGECLSLARQLAVSYVGLMLTLDMFPQVRDHVCDHSHINA